MEDKVNESLCGCLPRLGKEDEMILLADEANEGLCVAGRDWASRRDKEDKVAESEDVTGSCYRDLGG